MLFAFTPLNAAAGNTDNPVVPHDVFMPEIIITEFQTNGGSANQEFIELYNTTDTDIFLGDGTTVGEHWKIQFYGSSFMKDGVPAWSATPANTIVLKGIVPAHGYTVFSTVGYMPGSSEIPANNNFGTANSNFMADSGGGMRLVYVSGSTTPKSDVHDQIAWMDPAKKPTGVVLPAPAKTLSQQRHPNDKDTYFSDTDELIPFAGESEISPLEAWTPPEVVELPEEPVVPAEQDPATDESHHNVGLTPPVITELLPNPAAPAKDETDEYIELYNPNNSAFNLTGYSLQAGLSTLKEFTFTEDELVPAESYRTFLVTETRLSLTNTGSQVRLSAPDGTELDKTDPYTAAEEGAAWALVQGIWQWSTTPTAGQENVLTALAAGTTAKAASKAAPKTAAKKAAATKAKGTTKTKAAKAKKTTKKKAAKPKTAAVAQTSQKPPRAPIHTGVLVAVVGIAVLYAAYEYRTDIANRFYRLRGNRTIRAAARH